MLCWDVGGVLCARNACIVGAMISIRFVSVRSQKPEYYALAHMITMRACGYCSELNDHHCANFILSGYAWTAGQGYMHVTQDFAYQQIYPFFKKNCLLQIYFR